MYVNSILIIKLCDVMQSSNALKWHNLKLINFKICIYRAFNFHIHLGTPHAEKTVSHRLSDTLYNIATLPAHRRSLSFAPEWHISQYKRPKRLQWKHISSRNNRKTNMPMHELSTLQVGNHVAIQNASSRMWDIYGVITAIGPGV